MDYFKILRDIDLIWNNIILSSVDTLSANIVSGFNLTITFNPTDVIRLDGQSEHGTCSENLEMQSGKLPDGLMNRIFKFLIMEC